MNREVVFVADDFGLSESANLAIALACAKGRLDGAALMMGQPGTDAAVRLARAHPGLRVGLHLHLNDSTPCTVEAWPWGRSALRAGFAIGSTRARRRLVREEIRRQWQLFRETGLDCSFVSTHHHLHAHPYVFATLVEAVPNDFRGWIRLGDLRFFRPTPPERMLASAARIALRGRRRSCPFRVSDTLWGVDRLERMNAREITRVIGSLGEGLHEFMFHPRREGDEDTECLLELRRLLSPS